MIGHVLMSACVRRVISRPASSRRQPSDCNPQGEPETRA
jgi:hypothetical protein